MGTNSPTELVDIRGRLKVGEDDEFNVVLGYDFFCDDISMVHEGGAVIFSVAPNGQSIGYGGVGGNRTMWLKDDNVGIGTNNPTEKLEIKGNLKIAPDEDYNMTLGYSLFGSDDISMVHQIGGVVCSVDHDGQSIGYGGVGDNRTMWLKNGNVGIGKTTPSAKLHVDGNIIAEEIKVENVTGADFVFDPNYHLMPLAQIETYIKQNHHLPQVPSAAEMEANGIELGKMNMLLLQKIEELTLLMIEQQKEIQSLKSEVHQIKTSIK